MRKVLGFVLVGVAVLCFALAALARFYIPSRAEKTPLDTVATLYGNGSGVVLDTTKGRALPVTVRSIRHIRADSDASSGSVVVFRQGLCIVRNEPTATDCTHSATGLLSGLTERFASDRKSGESVVGYQDPVTHQPVSSLDGAPVVHRGLTIKFPFHAKKKTYQFWDYNIAAASPAVYAGTAVVAKLHVYRYTVHTPRTVFDLFPGVPGFYSDDRVLWVEPETGVIVQARDRQTKTLADGTLAAQLTITTAPESVSFQAKKARDGRNEISSITSRLPLILLIIGLVAAVGAVLLLRRTEDHTDSGAHRSESEPEPVPVVAG